MSSAADSLPAVTYERTPGAATAPLPASYRRRAPEQGALYQLVQAHLETFLAEPALRGANGYPPFIEREFRRFLDCGQLSHGLRAPFAQDRLSFLPDGRVRYELRRPWPTPTGVTELVFEPLQLMRRLTSLIPRPYTNLVRYFGAFAGRSKFRARLPLTPEAHVANSQARCAHAGAPDDGAQLTLALDDETTDGTDEETPEVDGTDEETPEVTLPVPRGPRTPWASLINRAFGIDPLRCECGATMTVLVMITAPQILDRILTHLGLPTHPPPIAPARLDPQIDLTLDEQPPRATSRRRLPGRAPA